MHTDKQASRTLSPSRARKVLISAFKHLSINIDKFGSTVKDGRLSNLDDGIAIVDEDLAASKEQMGQFLVKG